MVGKSELEPNPALETQVERLIAAASAELDAIQAEKNAIRDEIDRLVLDIGQKEARLEALDLRATWAHDLMHALRDQHER